MVIGDHDEGEEEMMVAATKPVWLEGLMSETFFSSCGIHESRRKSEKNVFCLLCCLSVCPHCLPSHRSHPLLQRFESKVQNVNITI
uniref:B box-type domain-containing protein n=1 Tax=Brassica oleracea var. oleracea TaxID=109376 RepID=A0A0D3CF30_BRAOL